MRKFLAVCSLVVAVVAGCMSEVVENQTTPEPMAGECATDRDCSDGQPCTYDWCAAGVCHHDLETTLTACGTDCDGDGEPDGQCFNGVCCDGVVDIVQHEGEPVFACVYLGC